MVWPHERPVLGRRTANGTSKRVTPGRGVWNDRGSKWGDHPQSLTARYLNSAVTMRTCQTIRVEGGRMISGVAVDGLPNAREDLQRAAAGIIDAYEMRVSAISSMMGRAYDLVRSYQRDVEKVLPIVRDDMAKGQDRPGSDFDEIIGDVVAAHAGREQQVLRHLQAFCAEEQEMIARLREIVAQEGACDVANLGKTQEDILTRERSRERQVIDLLRDYEIEEHELRAALRWLLSKGDKATVAHLRRIADAMTARWAAKERDVFEVVEQLEEARSHVRTRQGEVIDASA